VLRPEELLANEHFRSRGTFTDAEYAPGESGPTVSGFFELDADRQGYRHRAPTLGEHDDEVAAGIWPEPRPAPRGPAPAPSAPLAGLRVLDFGIGGVGVEAARLFADYGADVIKVESRAYPDFMRVVMSTEMSASFASSSRTKRGFGVNLKEERGLALIRELARSSDVVIENNSTGTMDSIGLGRAARGATGSATGRAPSRSAASYTCGATRIRRSPPARPRSFRTIWQVASPRSPRWPRSTDGIARTWEATSRWRRPRSWRT
jgi:crotonobetainyl-CoA:carnitine CoA-transferase CaiB-like acyl-CoA transferase